MATDDIWRPACPSGTLNRAMEQPIATHQDVTTVMELLADIRDEARWIRQLLEDDDGEEETEEDDLDS